MKRQLAQWMDTILDQRVVRGTRGTTLERFAAEAPHLRPLPAKPYDTARLVYRLCDAEACIAWEGNDYEVPYEHASDFLPVRITSTQVFVYARDLRCVATHDRLPKGQLGRARLVGRRPPGHARGDSLELLRPVFDDLGQAAADFLRGLERAYPRNTAHHARKVLALRARYKTADLVAAIQHALQFGAFDSAAVERIVESRARPRTLDEYVADATRERLADWMGECRTEPRSLHEYDDLPCLRTAKETATTCPHEPENHHLTQEPSTSQDPPPPPDQATSSSDDDSESTSGLTDAELDAHLAAALDQRPSYTQLLERLLGQAAARKRERCCERRIVESGMTVRKTLATFDWAFQPKLDRAVVEELAGLGFAQKQRDLLITGKPGTGKSHILMSIALLACEAGHLVRYARFVDLLTELHAGLADGSYERRLRRWARLPFVVLDDVGMGQVPAHADTPTAAHMLWSLIDLRHQRTTTAMSSNIKLSEWGKYLGDATVTAAILDRLAMTSIRLDIDGPSYRQHVAYQRAEHDDPTDAS